MNIIRLQSKIILGHMNSIAKNVRFHILGQVTTSWTYSSTILYIYLGITYGRRNIGLRCEVAWFGTLRGFFSSRTDIDWNLFRTDVQPIYYIIFRTIWKLTIIKNDCNIIWLTLSKMIKLHMPCFIPKSRIRMHLQLCDRQLW